MSQYFGPLTRLLVHPTAPVLLTKNGPLDNLILVYIYLSILHENSAIKI